MDHVESTIIETDGEGNPSVEPVSETLVGLKARVSSQRWQDLVDEARRKLAIVKEVCQLRKQSGKSWRRCLHQVAPEVPWPTFLGWRRRLAMRPGPRWERLLDRRDPPAPRKVLQEVRNATVALRKGDPRMSPAEARKHLTELYDDDGHLSNATLYRIWRKADLVRPDQGDPGRFERVERCYGGGGLALLGAAAAETGVPRAMARAALKAGQAVAAGQPRKEDAPRPSGRDEQGRFQKEFNHQVRAGVEPGRADERWRSDDRKRERCQLSGLQTLSLNEETVANRMLAIGLTPLLTDRRGFDGLDGPQGAWLGTVGPAYRPSTLDKTLTELALLKTDAALWEEHGRRWADYAHQWAPGGENWLQCAVFVDQHKEPYWTRQFALSGKVDRIGQVVPCLTRVSVTGGPGVPLRMQTFAGTRKLGEGLVELLEEVEQVAPIKGPFRLVVVDAEACNYEVLRALSSLKNHHAITVVKGALRKSVKVDPLGEWENYRERDQIRPVTLRWEGGKAPEGGLTLRGVEMDRKGGRHPHRTLFATTIPEELLLPTYVANTYLFRWPTQENVYRNARNGGGLDHTHGYGGEQVANFTVERKQDEATTELARARRALEREQNERDQIKSLTPASKETSDQNTKAADPLVRRAETRVRQAEKRLSRAEEAQGALSRYPDETFQRDTTRENIASCLSLMIMMLIEYVLRTYCGGLKMELRTFIEHFVRAPVTVRTTFQRILYQLEANPRSPERTEQLRRACDEINRRKIRRDERLLRFEVIDPPH